MHDLAELARVAGVKQSDLLALAPGNDPFALHLPARRRDAEWFAEMFRKFGFGQGVHCRRVHYVLVSSDPPVLRPDGRRYLNTTTCWSMLVNASRDARYLGLVNRHAFVDRRNPDPIIHFNSGRAPWLSVEGGDLWQAALYLDLPDLPRLDFGGGIYGPPVLVEIWCEKTTMNDILEPLARRFGVNLVTGAGDLSETACRRLGEQVRWAQRPARVLYISDFDPAGRNMPVSVARKLEFDLRDSLQDSNLDVTLEPLALTVQQVRDFALPRVPIKDSDLRRSGFEERFGEGAVELDALEALHPGALERIVRSAIGDYLDPDHQRALDAAVGEHQALLDEITEEVQEAFAPAVDALRAEWREIQVRAGAFRRHAKGVYDEMAEQLANTPVPEFVPPAPRLANEPEAPLYSSRRGYLEQMDHYRAWQGRS